MSSFNKFGRNNTCVDDCRYMPQLRRYSPAKLCDGAQMAIFASMYFQRAACSTYDEVTDLLNVDWRGAQN